MFFIMFLIASKLSTHIYVFLMDYLSLSIYFRSFYFYRVAIILVGMSRLEEPTYCSIWSFRLSEANIFFFDVNLGVIYFDFTV